MAYTGYIVRKYIDENPNSPTYGETWTEKTLDTTHCPNDGGGWSLVATECELVTSGFTGYRIDTYYNSVTNDYRTERTLDSICQASTDDEIWYNIGNVYCEQNDDGTYTGFGIQEQKQINPNLYNFGIVRKTRVASEECQEHLEPEWQQLSKECNIVQEIGTGTLHYDGTANILQIDINPSSPTFNQTRTINVEDEECEYIPCERMEYEWFYKEESCGSMIPEYYHLENLVPDTVYKIYQMYSKCYVDNVVVRERPENVYSAVTYQEGVSDCLYRWVQTEQTVCEDSYRERWVDSGTTCDNANKYNVQVKEVSEDGGETWSATSETRLGTMVEENSPDCGYMTRTESGTPYCDYSNYNKCVRVENQVSRDSGQTWETTATTIQVVEEHSEECGWVEWQHKYFTIVALEGGWIEFSGASASSFDNSSIQYAFNGNYSTWYTLNRGDRINVYNGWTVSFKSSTFGTANVKGIGRFFSGGRINLEGNAMSLLYGDNYEGKTDLTGKDYAFYALFSGNTKVVSAEKLYLPATTLSQMCYHSMFITCTSLTTPPQLPATTLAWTCYSHMFYGCTSLATAPALPATTMKYGCYTYMFGYCESLTELPALPATSLNEHCYGGMFQCCTSITSVPSNYLSKSTVLYHHCYAYMFEGCTSLTAAPDLPAYQLVEACYQAMFWNCSSLNYVKCLASDISASNCTEQWLLNTSSSGTFVKRSSTTWSRGTSGIPSNWTIQNYG